MISFIGAVLAKVVEAPRAPRYTHADEIVQQVRDAGGALDTDSFYESELDIVREAVDCGKLQVHRGSWADPDWLLLPLKPGRGGR